MDKVTIYCLLPLLIVFFGCAKQKEQGLKDQLACIQNEVVQNMALETTKEFMRQLNDTLIFWVDSIDSKILKRYKEIDFEISEMALFDEHMEKGIGFILKSRKPGEKMDFVKIITGERNAGVWNFHYVGNPSVSFMRPPKDPDFSVPFLKDSLEIGILRMIISDGYFKGRSCKRDYEYFDQQWFPEWLRMKDIRKMR